MTNVNTTIDNDAATALFRRAYACLESEPPDPEWVEKVERLSQLCEDANIRTHIAILGTSALAKAVRPSVDLFALKPNHAKGNPNSYSARSLSEKVLVPLAAELGINIGVTGRQPLNNQPYFRMTHLDDGTPVRGSAEAPFNYTKQLIREIQNDNGGCAALEALKAFMLVRRRYQASYAPHEGAATIRPEELAGRIALFVREESEYGRRAQAAVAGLIDVYAGRDRVISGRINDPSRRHPGDVCVADIDDGEGWEKAIEVRDKPVALSDVHIFGRKCIEMGVREVALVMVSDQQERLPTDMIGEWAEQMGIGITLFYTWDSLVDQVLYWAHSPKPEAANAALRHIHERLVEVEVSEDAVRRWSELSTELDPSSNP